MVKSPLYGPVSGIATLEQAPFPSLGGQGEGGNAGQLYSRETAIRWHNLPKSIFLQLTLFGAFFWSIHWWFFTTFFSVFSIVFPLLKRTVMLRLHSGCALSQKSYLRKDRIKFATHNYFSIFFVVFVFLSFGVPISNILSIRQLYSLSSDASNEPSLCPFSCILVRFRLYPALGWVWVFGTFSHPSFLESQYLVFWRVKSPFHARVGVILDLFSPFFGLFLVKMLGFGLLLEVKSPFYCRRIAILTKLTRLT